MIHEHFVRCTDKIQTLQISSIEFHNATNHKRAQLMRKNIDTGWFRSKQIQLLFQRGISISRIFYDVKK